jgi:hypothetical protein
LDYQVRAGRITDVERLVAILEEGGSLAAGPSAAADVLRQLVSLPQASVLVAESHRRIVGGAVLSLRPSAAAGSNVGVIDVLGVADGADAVGVTDVLLSELIRSARNKGCRVIEAPMPSDRSVRARWSRFGFEDSGPRLTCAISVPGGRTS